MMKALWIVRRAFFISQNKHKANEKNRRQKEGGGEKIEPTNRKTDC